MFLTEAWRHNLHCTHFSSSGTHWVFRILDMLVLGRAEFRDVHVDQVQYDFQLPEDLDKIPSPRVLHSHLSLKFQPPQILKKPKIVHLYRNPKAVIVSVYHGMKELDHFKALANIESVIAIVMHSTISFFQFCHCDLTHACVVVYVQEYLRMCMCCHACVGVCVFVPCSYLWACRKCVYKCFEYTRVHVCLLYTSYTDSL